jgi:tight adherence protein B
MHLPTGRRLPRIVTGALALTLMMLVTLVSPSFADGAGSIDHVQPENGALRVLFSVPGVGSHSDVNLRSIAVTLDGVPVRATARPAAESGQQVRRTTILAIDTSNSMRGQRFTEAKQAAVSFLDSVPDDVYVGIVSFAGDVTVVQKPTRDRAASKAVLNELTLSTQTKLYDGVLEATRSVGLDGQRSVLVLSDGRDTSATPLKDVTEGVHGAGVKVDVVALEQSGKSLEPLTAIAKAGGGSVLSANDPTALTQAFSSEADVLARQLLVTAVVPESHTSNEANLKVSVASAGQTYTDEAFVPVRVPVAQRAAIKKVDSPVAADTGGLSIPMPVMVGGLIAAALAIGFLVLQQLLNPGGSAKKVTLEDRIAAYSLNNEEPGASGYSIGRPDGSLDVDKSRQSVSTQAREAAQKALASNTGLESRIAARLEGAGMALKPAEWLLLHVGIVVVAGLVGLLISSGSVVLTLLFLALGLVVPWIYLGVKRNKRLAKFNGQLPETLQLMAGSLSAGLSLAQSIDTIEREGSEPIAGEFRRALVETRLGVPVEDSLESVAQRMDSRDFAWVVMAIRIQREVGGNLAELLLTVAATMREREYLRRHVSGLSAEGRLSCWILGGLPPAFLLYLVLTKPDYVHPMFTQPLGWLMCVAMAVLLSVGLFWMTRVVKVEV